ncbi:hypothetical protein [Bradyrhizobium liaoningense]
MFEINGFDTAGVVSLKRLSLAAAPQEGQGACRGRVQGRSGR